MLDSSLTLNESEVKRAKSRLARIDSAMAAQATFQPLKSGLPINVIQKHRAAINAYRSALAASLDEYAQAKLGNFNALSEKWQHEPGVILIIARLARGLSQADLAKKLGLKEQQVQRYEADRYKTISLANFKRISSALNVRLTTSIGDSTNPWLSFDQPTNESFTTSELNKILKHAVANRWFSDSEVGEQNQASLLEYIADEKSQFGSLAFLRTGLSVEDLSQDASLIAWRARITKLAEEELKSIPESLDFLDISWLPDLAKLSRGDRGPLDAQDFLKARGILLLTERQIPGLNLDGAAFLVRGIPVISLTLRHDRLDNFWFTLMHELAHVLLHHQVGLQVGFFDDLDQSHVDQVEAEANDFAESVLIPPDRWKISPARISLDAAPIDDFARQLNIHPAIVFGRVRRERNNYKIFWDRVGSGEVRKWFENTQRS